MMHLEDYLQRHAQQQPDKIAAVSANQTISYGQLWQQVQQESRRYTPGVPVPFTTTQDINFLITYMAIHHAGAIAIPLPSMVPTGSICCDTLPPGLADILFTTGTTGTSKGVMISHKALMADAENLIEGQLFCNDLTFVISGPLNHIGSLSKIWPVITLGATLHILEGMKDLNAFFTALCSYPKTATFLVPANTRMILQLCPQRLAEVAPHIDFIESGAAPLPHTDMQELCRLLPHARLYNTYASTETGIISTYNFNDGRCIPGCLGRPMSHSHISITSEGHVACTGDTLMSGYTGTPATDWHPHIITTSDLGHLDDEGMLRLTGRESDVINVGGFKVAPAEVEEAAMSLPTVKDCICIATPHPITGQALKLLVVTPQGCSLDKRQTARQLSQLLEPHKVPMLYEQVDHICRTYNGKLDRKAYQQ